jgi:D-hydroxyproline dehydrogenase subunit beta
MAHTADVVIIGAGALGAACAYFASEQGLRVHIVERGEISCGTTSACEGNLLVSDKEAGYELDLALYSNKVWRSDLAPHNHLWEFENKGGLIVAATDAGAQNLVELSRRQRDAGIEVTNVAADEVHAYEPHITEDLTAAAFYPQDCQVQPMLMAAHLVRLARERRAQIWTRAEVTELLRDGDAMTGVVTSRGTIHADHVINAAGTWAADIAQLAGVRVPILPRRGFVLITEPLPRTVFHKVYSGDYVASTTSSDEELQTSTVIEGTRAGTILIGSSRERVGFDSTVSLPALRQIAAKAMGLYPALAKTKIMRNYSGFRPYCADHLPVIGHDPRAPGLWHATGHEGAGIGLAVGSAKLLVQQMTGNEPDLDLAPFAPERFDLAETS